MKALVYQGPWQLTVEELSEPRPAPGQILLEIVATGICGSDLHGFTGENGRRHPGQVMGHETVGRVLLDPSGTMQPGTVVTVNPVIGCGACQLCAQGKPQRCPDRTVIGVNRELQSAFAERMVAPASNVVRLTAGTPMELGCLVEPLSVGYHAAQRGGATVDDAVWIIGAGPIGQAAALATRRLGVTNVVVTDPDPSRRSLLKRLGFSALDPSEHLDRDLASILGGVPTVVIDAVGTTATLASALSSSSPGARIVLVGMNQPQIDLRAYGVTVDEREIVGSFCYTPSDFESTVAWVGAHAEQLGVLIEKRVDLKDAVETFHSIASGELRASKALVFMSQNF